MTAPNLVVDTSVVVDLLIGDEKLGQMVEQARPVGIPGVVLAELLAGARRSQRALENVQQVEEFAERNMVISCDPDTASLTRISPMNSARVAGAFRRTTCGSPPSRSSTDCLWLLAMPTSRTSNRSLAYPADAGSEP